MYRLDSVEFFAQMELKRIYLSLTEQEPRYIVYCRQIENDFLQEFKFNISYADESQTQLIFLREELTGNHPRPLETIISRWGASSYFNQCRWENCNVGDVYESFI